MRDISTQISNDDIATETKKKYYCQMEMIKMVTIKEGQNSYVSSDVMS